jgi:LPS-assembly lipoprotein
MKMSASLCYRIFVYLLFSLSLSACGFHLRGAMRLPPELNPIYIDSDQPYSPFEQALRASLESSNIQIVNSPSPQAATLQIINRNLTSSLVTISANTFTTQYNVTYAITYQVIDRHKNVVIPSNTITSANTYSANNTQMLGAANQQDALVDTLRNNTVFLLLTRLGSKQVRDAFQKGKSSDAR